MESKRTYVSTHERTEIARAVCLWLNEYPDKPVRKIDYEFIGETGIMVSTIQAPYKIKQFIDGSYRAQYQFDIVYRARPNTDDARLHMDEVLESMAAWCEENRPTLAGNMIAQKVECTNNSSIFARYEDGSEDHQITLNLFYEVN